MKHEGGRRKDGKEFPRLYEPAEESELHGWLKLLALIEFAVLGCLLAAYGGAALFTWLKSID